MIQLPLPVDFDAFRLQAKALLAQRISPCSVTFYAAQQSLFSVNSSHLSSIDVPASLFTVPRERMRWLKSLALFRSNDIWDLLYRLLWKLRGDPFALDNPADPDVLDAERRVKQVSSDIHKMHAYVRFNRTYLNGEEYFVAWHKPQHKIVRTAATFFKRRFGAMRWSILSPDESVHWDLTSLTFSAGVHQPPSFTDNFETYWLTYYSSIFNPARVKIKAMKREMPERYWQSMPETRLIGRLLEEVPERLERMREVSQPRATVPYLQSLDTLKVACHECSCCPIACLRGTPVFGEGSLHARVVFVGDQPEEIDEREGRPFVGPAGQLLREVMVECGVDAAAAYFTYAVKHRKWVHKGSRRVQQNPNGAEILACKPWLTSELQALRPFVIVCLGATAAQSVLGLKVSVAKEFDKEHVGPEGARVFVTHHPSAALENIPDEKRIETVFALRAMMLRVSAALTEGNLTPAESAESSLRSDPYLQN